MTLETPSGTKVVEVSPESIVYLGGGALEVATMGCRAIDQRACIAAGTTCGSLGQH